MDGHGIAWHHKSPLSDIEKESARKHNVLLLQSRVEAQTNSHISDPVSRWFLCLKMYMYIS